MLAALYASADVPQAITDLETVTSVQDGADEQNHASATSIAVTSVPPAAPGISIDEVQLVEGNGGTTTKIAGDPDGGPTLADDDEYGNSLASLGDMDGDGIRELAVGAWEDDTGGKPAGRCTCCS